MKKLTTLDLQTISGGNAEQLTVTQKISVEGFSENCINTLINNFASANGLPDDELNKLYIKILSNCTMAEMDLLDSRGDTAPYLTVSYK